MKYEMINDLVAPLFVAQIFLFVYIYFFIVRKRLGSSFKYYSLFIVFLIIYVVTRPVQASAVASAKTAVLYLRFLFFYAIVAPSLFITTLSLSRKDFSLRLIKAAYIMGVAISLGYILSFDFAQRHLFFNNSELPQFLSFLEPLLTRDARHLIQGAGSLLLLV